MYGQIGGVTQLQAEYIAAVDAGKEVLWMKNFLQELGMKQEKYVMFCDSQSAIHLAKNSSYHSRTKHIDVRYHWTRDVVSSKLLKLEKIHTDDNGSDMMTKTLPNEKLQACCKVAGMAVLPHESEGEIFWDILLIWAVRRWQLEAF